uniref:IF rod domain-containing protein n=1 Tax=Nannospalax galili TaxID=1026970 RepID=A0A8C6QTF1_NANGA
MLSWRLQTGFEKAELQELNARLYDYVCRVRELERENLLLEQELRSRLGQESRWAEGQARFAEEARSLRQQLDELSWATALAEGERDALRRELRELQRQDAEASAARGRLDAELGAERRELQEALGARAALEALLDRLPRRRPRRAPAAPAGCARQLRAAAGRVVAGKRAAVRGRGARAGAGAAPRPGEPARGGGGGASVCTGGRRAAARGARAGADARAAGGRADADAGRVLTAGGGEAGPCARTATLPRNSLLSHTTGVGQGPGSRGEYT